ncbi:transcription factor 19-like [Ptychodera flava]|uniref:transcription factor 19-like n=1 Tax=Ptychodera flava TaxID=63121 RepID=UPI00396A9054
MGKEDIFNFQFRRIGLPATCRGVPDVFRITKTRTLIGRNKDEVDFFLFSSVHKKLISRVHAELIVQCKQEIHSPTYHLIDRSTNGTYVNDVKVAGSACLKHGDKITFGHIRGIGVHPGSYSQQFNTEFIFRFEQCEEKRKVGVLPSTPPREVNSVLSMTWNSNSISPLSMIRRTGGPREFRRKGKLLALSSHSNLATPGLRPKLVERDSGVFDNDLFDSDEDDNELLKLAEKIGVDFAALTVKEDIFHQWADQSAFSFHSHRAIIKQARRGISSPAGIQLDIHFQGYGMTPEPAPVIMPVVMSAPAVIATAKRKRGRPAGKTKKRPTPYEKKKAATKQSAGNLEKEWDRCDFYACQRPQDDTVAWVQCDDCDGWYHVDCMGCTYDAVRDTRTAFHCGCI